MISTTGIGIVVTNLDVFHPFHLLKKPAILQYWNPLFTVGYYVHTKKSICTVNNKVLYIPGGAGFLSSTVSHLQLGDFRPLRGPCWSLIYIYIFLEFSRQPHAPNMKSWVEIQTSNHPLRFGMTGPPKKIPIKHRTWGGMTGCLGIVVKVCKHCSSSPLLSLSRSQVGQSIHPLDSLEAIFVGGRNLPPFPKLLNKTVDFFWIGIPTVWFWNTHTKGNLHTFMSI